MKYFFIETDETNKIPYNINKNRVIDIRWLNRKEFEKIPMRSVLEMDIPTEVFFPDLICSPCILMSEICIDAALLYQPEIPYKVVKLWHRDSGINRTYFLTIPDEADCLSDKTEYNSVGNRIVRMVLDKEKIGDRAVFRIKDCAQKGIVGSLDFVESMLRRGGRGIKLEEIEVR